MSQGSHSWSRPGEGLAAFVEQETANSLAAYRVQPHLVAEHYGIERATAQGGYGRRQLYELIQNGADALLEAGTVGRIVVLLFDDVLYCANEGAPLDEDGITTILHSHFSAKRGEEIGRFGLGFKSVLGVSDRPQLFSKSVSLGFDAERSAERIREVVPDQPAYPVLRYTQVLDPVEEAAADPTLGNLMQWASTVAKLPLRQGAGAWLSEDLAEFPGEFLLFSPHVSPLQLEDLRGAEEGRELSSVRGDDGTVDLRVDGVRSRWQVLRRTYRPSPAARDDANEAFLRDTLPIMWAVPLDRGRPGGEFWAFFPTEYECAVDGILNAPWKTNEDRQNLLRGVFNDELLNAAADLIIDNLAAQSSEDDPGAHVDLLPTLEPSNWADERLATRVYRQVRGRALLPDQSASLRRPDELSLAPNPRVMGGEALQRWAAAEDRPRDWVHHSALSRYRYRRVERLVGEEASVQDWLEDLARVGSVGASAAAIRAAEAALQQPLLPQSQADAVRRSRIVLTADGSLAAITAKDLVFSDELERPPEGLRAVHPDLVDERGVRRILSRAGVQTLSGGDELAAIASRLAAGNEVGEDEFWDAVHVVGEEARSRLEELGVDRHRVRVRTASGQWAAPENVLREGPILNAAEAPEHCIDAAFHAHDDQVLQWLRIRREPMPAVERYHNQEWFTRYLQAARDRYYREHPGLHSKPQRDKLVFPHRDGPGPTRFLWKLRGEMLARYTVALLDQLDPNASWALKHVTVKHYPAMEHQHPVIWLCRQHGALPTSQGSRPVAECVGPGLYEYRDLLPVAECSPVLAEELGLPDQLEDLPSSRLEALAADATRSLDLERAGRLLAALAPLVPRPAHLEAATSAPGADEHAVRVTTDAQLAASLRQRGAPVVLAPSQEAAVALSEHWGLRPADEDAERQRRTLGASAAVPLVDEVPPLRGRLGVDEGMMLVRCEEIGLEHLLDGHVDYRERLCLREGETVYVDARLEGEDLLTALDQELGLGLSDEAIQQALAEEASQQQVEARRQVRARPTVPQKISSAIGESNLRARLPAPLTVDVDHGDAQRLGEVALAVHGVEVLTAFRHYLEANGLEPPRSWRGSRPALDFVRELGLPDVYAGFPAAQRDAQVTVRGRPQLPELHDFQDAISGDLRLLLAGDSGYTRGLISLPTGAGKTRVAVQAILEELAASDQIQRVVWVAQTEELCEQAVQAFAEVWRAVGPDLPLVISRLWDAQEAARADHDHVVVATIHKLRSIAETRSERYAWLRENLLCLVIDEAHGSTTASYTDLLRLLDFEVRGGAREDPAAIVGLTATPFRGRTDEETRPLVARYRRNRLDAAFFGEDDPYPQLQKRGVLADVEHEVLDGISIELRDDERRHYEHHRFLPGSVERRVGDDRTRNRRIVERIASWPSDWPVLLFAASVQHAQVLSGMLQLAGIPSAPIWSEVSRGARRHYIEQFRAGHLRVLTNYNVLAEGFDAPATRAVVLARPTFSPARYQQMVGRGLRGPLNGGKPVCRIVDIADNIARFDRELAYREFEHLWRRAGTELSA